MNMLKTLAAAALATTVAIAAPPAVPATPAAVQDIVYARPFTLVTGYTHYWRAEKPVVTSGYIVVLKVNPDLVYPRQQAEPVLYVGDQTAQRLNVGYRSGHVVAFVPGALEGEHKLDLTKAQMWFGTPELPERVDAARIAQEKALATSVGIKAFDAAKIEALLAKSGGVLAEASDAKLLDDVADLIDQYSPQEAEIAVAYRASATGAAATPTPVGN
jgi:hypothetical protein